VGLAMYWEINVVAPASNNSRSFADRFQVMTIVKFGGPKIQRYTPSGAGERSQPP